MSDRFDFVMCYFYSGGASVRPGIALLLLLAITYRLLRNKPLSKPELAYCPFMSNGAQLFHTLFLSHTDILVGWTYYYQTPLCLVCISD